MLKKEMLSRLKDTLLSKSRKGNLITILKKIVKEEFYISDGSQQYDDYEKLIDENIVSIKNILEKEDIPGVTIEFITDDYIQITVYNELSDIKRELNTLNGDNFETLCEEILNIHVKGTVKRTTKHSYEDKHCVDITGNLSIIDDVPVQVKLYAQVKNKSGQILLNDVKEFLGGVKLVMSDKGKEYGYMHSYVLLYISASDFQEDAIEYMNKIGIIHINGYQIAQLIKRYNFDYKKFRNN